MKILLLFLLIPINLFCDSNREMRAAWIATVFNIDWPNSYVAEEQKKEMIDLLDTLTNLNFNAVILQVKPTSDAFYKSKMSPWSRYLTGTQGKDPGYDPLQFFIEESRKRLLEIHVWVNPYRILNGEQKSSLVNTHISLKNPTWVVEYNGRYYFDPGNPDVQKYVIKEIMEIVRNYDIDVLHMDDYFYPYKVYKNGQLLHFDDDKSFKKYGKKLSRDDWRRKNTDDFVKALSESVKSAKSHVKFGISPFGVWRNKSEDPKGSDSDAGQTNYDDLYADVLKWIDNKWIDYIMPQIYWHFDTKGVNFDVLVDWWVKNTKDKINLYIGIGAYKLGENNWPAKYLREQVYYTRKQETQGVAYYSLKWIHNNTKNIIPEIKNVIHKKQALVPENSNVEKIIPQYPQHVKGEIKDGKKIITWKNNDKGKTMYFVVYQIDNGYKTILAKIPATSELKYTIDKYEDHLEYGVSAVSRLHNESVIVMTDQEEKYQGLDQIDALLAE